MLRSPWPKRVQRSVLERVEDVTRGRRWGRWGHGAIPAVAPARTLLEAPAADPQPPHAQHRQSPAQALPRRVPSPGENPALLFALTPTPSCQPLISSSGTTGIARGGAPDLHHLSSPVLIASLIGHLLSSRQQQMLMLPSP